jgi:hypothetical protein
MDLHKWLETARAGKALELRYDVEMMSTQPSIDELRVLVEESDVAWILDNLLAYDDRKRVGFFPGLSAKFATRPDVAKALQAAWGDASDIQKSKLCWRIADSPNLSIDWHRTLFDFVLEKWEIFQEISSDFYGQDYAVSMANIAERYLGRKFVPTKGWLYVCNAWYLKDIYPGIVEHLCTLAAASEFEFERIVCSELRERKSLPSAK